MSRKGTVSVTPIQTSVFHSGDSLLAFLGQHLNRSLLEGSVLAITSKIVSIAENRVKHNVQRKDLAKEEADHFLCEGGYGSQLTIKHGTLIPSAGIDESNSESGGLILYPVDPYASASKIGEGLKAKFKLRQLGVILTDSHSMPLRRGVTGVSIGHWGIRGTHPLAGQPDLFGRELKYTHVDVVDSLAAMAVFVMGEAANRTPLAVITGADVEFTEATSKNEILIAPQDDLYYPLFAPFLKMKH